MAKLLFAALLSFILIIPSVQAIELHPFEWDYNVVYKQKKRAYNGYGNYKLERGIGGNWYFSLSVRTHNRIFSAVDKTVFYTDNTRIVVPVEKTRRSVIFGIPVNKNVELDLDNEYAYDSLTAILRLLHDLQLPEITSPRWHLWLAEESKYRDFILRRQERIHAANQLIDCYVIEMEEEQAERSFIIWVAKKGNYIVKMVRKRKNSEIIMELANVLDTDKSI